MTQPDYHNLVRRDVFSMIAPCERLLDLGGGTGATAAELKRIGRCHWAGVIDRIKGSFNAELDYALCADLEQGAALNAALTHHGPFDTILCLDVLEHLIQPERLLEQVFAALRPGGRLIVSIPNVRHVSVLVPLLLNGRWDYASTGVLDRTHLRFFTRHSARAMIEQAGFRIERVQHSATATRWQRLANVLTLSLLRDLFTIQYYFAARKKN